MGNGTPSSTIRSYRDLVAWQRAFALGLAVYRVARAFPDTERFGLTSQIRRSAISIASNIAEGYGRGSRVEYVRFLKIARGSLFEVETQIAFAFELQYISAEQASEIQDHINETARVLSGLIATMERDDN